MKEYSVFVSAPDTAFRVIKIKAKSFEWGGDIVVFKNDQTLVAEFSTAKIIGISETSHVA